MSSTLLALWLVGCVPDGLIPDLQIDDTDTDTTDTDTTPVTYVNDDEGSVIIIQWLPDVEAPDPVTVARGMFVENARDIRNLAQCVGLRDLWCTEEWPENYGDVVRVEPYDDELLELLTGTFIGEELVFGPWTLNYTEDASFGLPVYTRFYDQITPADGSLEMSVAGEWSPWTGAVLEAPTPFELTSHDPMVRHEFLSTEPLKLTWETGDVGDIFLYVRAPNGEFLQRLADTGEAELNLNLFQIEEGDDVALYIGRWSEATIDLDGNEVNAQVQINQWLYGTYRAFGQRQDLNPLMFDDCSTASGAVPVGQGLYYADLAGYANDFTPPEGQCTGDVAPGPDAIVPLRIQANEFLEVEYDPLAAGDDAVLYLMTADVCDAGPGVCLVGADTKLGGGLESIGYRNETAFAEELYLVIDMYNANPRDSFYVNIGVEPSLSDPLVSSCAEAIAQGPIDEGSYFGQMGTFPNLLECDPIDPIDPGDQQPGTGAGGDGKAEIYLLPGQTLLAQITTSGTPYMYVVYNCSLSKSCAMNGVSNTTLSYTNESTVSESVYLVVDSVDFTGTVQDYFLDIEIQ